MPKYSLIVPVYNRPAEVDELLHSLTVQTFTDFEVVLVEDGSQDRCDHLVEKYSSLFSILYFFKPNEGQGFARNYGYKKANGQYLIVMDSDCLVPPNYFEEVDNFLNSKPVDAFGGPDTAHQSFTITQKAISHTMTSFFTTGGMRGREKHIGEYHPRSFNMGISRRVFAATKGYVIPFMGEDLEFSTRIIKNGFSTALIPKAYVYHKRRTSLIKFYKQINYFGRARINLTRFHPDQLKPMHCFPTLFTLGLLVCSALAAFQNALGYLGLGVIAMYLLAIFIEALLVTSSLWVALLTPITALIQLIAYGTGLVHEYVQKVRGKNPNKKYIELY